jgi:hypothetical protein
MNLPIYLELEAGGYRLGAPLRAAASWRSRGAGADDLNVPTNAIIDGNRT